MLLRAVAAAMQRRRASRQLEDAASAAETLAAGGENGGEIAGPANDDRTGESRPTGSSGDGGLLRGLAPVEPVDFLVNMET